jgi:hypothetical protein
LDQAVAPEHMRMRTLLGFFSLLALGFVMAAWIAVAGTGSIAQYPNAAMHPGDGFSLDYPSVLLGLAIGISLSVFGRFSWADLPRRAIAWILNNERNFFRAGIAAVLVGVLVFY